MVTRPSDDAWIGEPLTTKEGWRRFVDRHRRRLRCST